MKYTAAVITGAFAFAATLPAAPAQAQTTRSFVSANGSDSNLSCTRATPCRTFQWAHDRTDGGGEINPLDPADYGPVTITKDISIVNDGVGSAGILVLNGQVGITINGNASIRVNLRGLFIKGHGGLDQTGIVFSSGKSLTIENCVVRNLLGDGIHFVPNASSSLAVSDTFIADNIGNAIFVGPSGSGTVKADFNRIEMHNNLPGGAGVFIRGINSTGTISATVSDSMASNNGSGFSVESAAGQARTQLIVIHSVASNNGIGLGAEGTGAILRVTQSIVTGNTTGWTAFSAGVLLSAADNTIEGNVGGESIPPSYAKK